MWYNDGVSDPFIFFIASPNKIINNKNSKREFMKLFISGEVENYRRNIFSKPLKQLAPDLITYWKEE